MIMVGHQPPALGGLVGNLQSIQSQEYRGRLPKSRNHSWKREGVVYRGKINKRFWRRQSSGRALKDKKNRESKLMRAFV